MRPDRNARGIATRLVAILLAALAAVAVQAAPSSQPDKKTDKKPASEHTADQRRLGRLMAQSMQQMKQKKYPEAEKTLQSALAIDPKQPTNLYNMACLKALTGKPDEAMDYLEKSTEQGFVDFPLISHDEDLTSIRDLPRFKKLMGRKDELQERFAKEMVKTLEKQFGKGYIYEIDHADKLIFATNTDRTTLEALKKNLIRQAQGLRKVVFTEKPDQYINVVLPSLKDYTKLVPSPVIAGFYNNETRTLISRQLGQVVTHEFTHALDFEDFQPLGQEHPIWLLEGFATLFESITWDNDKLTPHDGEHLIGLHQLAKADKLIPLAKLMKMTQPQFMRNPMAAYGESGSVLLYLYEKNDLRKFYDAVKAGYNEKAPDRGTIAALEKVTGKKLPEFESEWRQWMIGRTPPPQNTGPEGPFLGLKFAQGNDGLKVEQVVPDGPAAKAGIKPGDVIVGLDDAEVRDHQTLVPLLKNHQVGDRVALKVRRDSAYQDMPVVLAKRPEESPANDPFGEIQLTPGKGGLLVVGFAEDGPAAKAGLQINDLLIGINQFPIKNQRSLMTAMEKLQGQANDKLTIKVRRDDKDLTLDVKLDNPPPAKP